MLPRNLLATLCVVLVLVGNPAFCADDDPQRFLINNPDRYKGLQLTCCLDKAPCGQELIQRRVKDVKEDWCRDILRDGYQKRLTKDSEVVFVKEDMEIYPGIFKMVCDNCQKQTYETYEGQDTYIYQCKKEHRICPTCLDRKLKNVSDDAKKVPINIKNDNPNLEINPFELRKPNKPPSMLRDPKLWIALLLVGVLVAVMYCLPMESSEKRASK